MTLEEMLLIESYNRWLFVSFRLSINIPHRLNIMKSCCALLAFIHMHLHMVIPLLKVSFINCNSTYCSSPRIHATS